jgi:hypothetical protein
MIATVWFVYIQMIPYEIISGEKAPRFADSVFGVSRLNLII